MVRESGKHLVLGGGANRSMSHSPGGRGLWDARAGACTPATVAGKLCPIAVQRLPGFGALATAANERAYAHRTGARCGAATSSPRRTIGRDRADHHRRRLSRTRRVAAGAARRKRRGPARGRRLLGSSAQRRPRRPAWPRALLRQDGGVAVQRARSLSHNAQLDAARVAQDRADRADQAKHDYLSHDARAAHVAERDHRLRSTAGDDGGFTRSR